MKYSLKPSRALILAIVAASTWTGAAPPGWAEAPQKAVNAFNAYVAKVESRLAQQHKSSAGFLADMQSSGNAEGRLRHGEIVIEKLTPDKGEVPDGMLHHWRGTAFAKGATAADFERLMKNLSRYPRMYSPQVESASIISPQRVPVPDHFTASMRVKQKHVLTVVMDTFYDVTYGRLDAR